MIRKMVSAVLALVLTAGLMVLSTVDLAVVPVARSDSPGVICPGLMAEMDVRSVACAVELPMVIADRQCWKKLRQR